MLVVGDHMRQVRGGGEEQRRALEHAGCDAAPARPDGDREHAAEDAARDQLPREVAELPLTGSHSQLGAGRFAKRPSVGVDLNEALPLVG